MARSSLIFIIVYALFGAVFASAKTPSFVPLSSSTAESNRSVNRALAVRGGDHLDPTDTAKIGAILAGTEAVLTLMSPSRMFDLYRREPPTPMSEFLAQWYGSTILSFVLYSWNIIVNKSSLQESAAVACIPWIIMQYKTFWNQDHKKLGYSLGPQLIDAVLAPITFYVCKTADASIAKGLLQACALWLSVRMLVVVLAPGVACEAYGLEATEENKTSLKTLGFIGTGSAVFQLLVTFTDVDSVRAFGFAWVPPLIMQLSDNFLSNGISFAWTLVDIVVVLVCGFQIG